LPHHQGGVEVYTNDLARALAKSHALLIYAWEGYRPSFQEVGSQYLGLPVKRVYTPQPRSPWGLFLANFSNRSAEDSFARTLDLFQPDVVHFQHLMNLSSRLVEMTKARRIPIVVSLHDYWYICGNAQFLRPDATLCWSHHSWDCAGCAAARIGMWGLKWIAPFLGLLFIYRDRLLRRALEMADGLIVSSRFLKSRYMSRGFPEGKIFLTEYGLDLERLLRGYRKRDAPHLRFGYIGSLCWQKGVHILLEAFAGLGERAELNVFGDPTIFPDYSSKLEQLSSKGVRFWGRIDNQKMGEILSLIDVLVVPSLWFEGSPLVIQAAYATRIPILASRVGSLIEKVDDGVSGFLFELGDRADLRSKMLSLLNNREVVEEMAKRLPEPKAIAYHAQELETLYQSLLGGTE